MAAPLEPFWRIPLAALCRLRQAMRLNPNSFMVIFFGIAGVVTLGLIWVLTCWG